MRQLGRFQVWDRLWRRAFLLTTPRQTAAGSFCVRGFGTVRAISGPAHPANDAGPADSTAVG
ncbi:hypothetical protein LJ737_25500, partial [Hymenobacter sp. 15J16-1T3B]|uniref:hypothetical protein n=1 Tax=Hymenobacter sp. 15J16-1T3B TaxID=2886941 RepID=UPI001D0FB028